MNTLFNTDLKGSSLPSMTDKTLQMDVVRVGKKALL
jgi:hypothetical protein